MPKCRGYEGAADITLDCSVTLEPSGATYAWAARVRRVGTSLLSSTSILKPTFDVPDNVYGDTDYEYRVTLSASGIDDITADVTVTVLEKPDITSHAKTAPMRWTKGTTTLNWNARRRVRLGTIRTIHGPGHRPPI